MVRKNTPFKTQPTSNSSMGSPSAAVVLTLCQMSMANCAARHSPLRLPSPSNLNSFVHKLFIKGMACHRCQSSRETTVQTEQGLPKGLPKGLPNGLPNGPPKAKDPLARGKEEQSSKCLKYHSGQSASSAPEHAPEHMSGHAPEPTPTPEPAPASASASRSVLGRARSYKFKRTVMNASECGPHARSTKLPTTGSSQSSYTWQECQIVLKKKTKKDGKPRTPSFLPLSRRREGH
jgi:hypothetical protein